MSKRVIFLLVLGLSQMVGDLTQIRALKGLAAATNAAPAPKVFCSAKGLETFSSEFTISYTDCFGVQGKMPLTRKVRMMGPYNRRNMYGAALAYGPLLPAELRDPILNYGLGRDGILLEELGLIGATEVRVNIQSKQPCPQHDLTLEVR